MDTPEHKLNRFPVNHRNLSFTTDFGFTLTEIITKIAHWELEPLTLEEQSALLKHFTSTDYPKDNPSFTFGENDIESLILETLSEFNL